MKQLITIIAPMYNEEETVEEYCKITNEVMKKIEKKYDYEILLINDGSKDKTINKMMEMQQKNKEHIGIIDLTRNFGLEGAVSAGLKISSGDITIVMDADLQDPPSLILEMMKKYENGADIVVASREKRSNDNLFKKFSASFYYKVLDILSGKLKLEKSAANFRLLSRKALDKLKELPEVNGVFRVIVPFIGMHTDTVKYDREKRNAGFTKYNLKSMIRYALDSITGISIEPLRKIIWTIPIAGIFVGLCFCGYIFSSEKYKLAFIICGVISFFFGILFIVIAIIGEYIAQIMIEVKHRPTSMIYSYSPSKNEKRG